MTNPLSDINQYSPTFKIAQVLAFCKRKNLSLTRPMIQNYIRDGLLPPPVNGRQYTHKHLAALVMIDRLKTVFDMPTIKEALLPYMDEDGLPMEVYSQLLERLNMLMLQFMQAAAPTFAEENDGGTLLSMIFAAEVKASVVGE